MAVTLPWGPALPNVMFAVIAVFWVLHLLFGKITLTKKTLKHLFFFTAYYLFYTVSFFYSENLLYFQKKILLQSFLLLSPLIVFTIPYQLKQSQIEKIIYFFTISVFVFGLVSAGAQAVNTVKSGQGFNAALFTSNNLSNAIGSIHYLSLSLYALVSFAFMVYKVFCFQRKHTLFNLVLLFGLFALLILLGSRTALFLSVIIVLVASVFSIKKPIGKIAFLLVFSTIFLLFFNTKTQQKWVEIINYENNTQTGSHYWGGTGMRLLIWDCALKVSQNHLWLGVGVGDEQDRLTLCYKVYMKNQLLVGNSVFHAHNIFLQSLVRSGLIGLLLFISFLVYTSYYSYTRKNYFYVVFCLLFSLSGLTESYLIINAGVLFFAFFSTILYKKTLKA